MVDSRTKHQTHFNLTQPPFGAQFSRIHVSGSTKSNWWDWSRCLFTFDGYFWMKWIIWALNHFVGDESKKKQSNQTYTLIVKHSFFSTQFRMEQRPYSHFCVTHIANASPMRHTEASPVFPTSFCGVFMHMWPYGVTKEFKLCCLPCWFTRWYCGMFWPGIEIILTGSLYSL